MRITVKAWKQVIDANYMEMDEETLQNLKLSNKHTWTNTQIVVDDILEHYEYKSSTTSSSSKTVLEFADGRPRMIIKESFNEFTARLKTIEDLMRLKYALEEEDDLSLLEEEEEDEEDK